MVTDRLTTARDDWTHEHRSGTRLAGVTATGLLAIATFQGALAVGAPLGRAAWGGAHAGRLPSELRVASAVSAGFWLGAALTVLARGGVVWSPVPLSVSRWGTRALVAVLGTGAAMNVASASRWERFGWAPLAAVLTVGCARLSRTDMPVR